MRQRKTLAGAVAKSLEVYSSSVIGDVLARASYRLKATQPLFDATGLRGPRNRFAVHILQESQQRLAKARSVACWA
eukprot:3909741-Pleurochrysis_carterae.AAC.1